MIKNIIKDYFKDETRVIFTVLIMSMFTLPITYSRYIQSDRGTLSAAVASWNVNFVGGNNNLELVALNNSSATYSLSVTSLSEVACNYTVIMSNIPSGVKIIVDNDSAHPYTGDSYGVLILENVGGFEINSTNQTNNHSLVFVGDENLEAGSSNINIQVDIKQRVS